jgi:NAD(P)-dependent dehydrogenase (short-subunit alcohol dehydrogenase family)
MPILTLGATCCTVEHMTADRWTPDRIPDQTGRTFLVTGATSGLGLVTARMLIARGALVIVGVRDEQKARRALKNTAEILRLDLADLDSVRAFAARFRDNHDRIDVLINNAAVMAAPRALSPQGFERQWATNHLGHFALTGLLFDLIRDRVVTVTSLNHKMAKLPYTSPKRYSPMGVYNTSKLAAAIFGVELSRRQTAIRSVLAHPGYAATGLQTSATTPFYRFFYGVLGNRVLAQPAERGAWPQLFAATAPSVQSGQLIGPDGPAELRGHPTVRRLSSAATDPGNGRRLWELSERETGVRFLDVEAAA